MTQMIPEALPVRVDTTPAVVVSVTGPGGLIATLICPDASEAYDALDVFVGALPEAITQGMLEASEALDG